MIATFLSLLKNRSVLLIGLLFSLQVMLYANITGNLQSENAFDIYPSSEGYMTVKIPANSFADQSFASTEVVVFYDEAATDIHQLKDKSISIFPNPSKDGLINIQNELSKPCTVELLLGDSSVIRTISLHGGEYQQINLQDLKKGIHILKIVTTATWSVHKLIID
jgi:hypothetical protein